MPQDPMPSDEQILRAVVQIGHGHLSTSRAALPFILPVRVTAGTELHGRASLHLLSPHASLRTSARRCEIAALQVDATFGGHAWSLLVTGPLFLEAPTVCLPLAQAIVRAECLSSPHGHSIDPLPRAPLAEGA